jgi:hypothetical protein
VSNSSSIRHLTGYFTVHSLLLFTRTLLPTHSRPLLPPNLLHRNHTPALKRPRAIPPPLPIPLSPIRPGALLHRAFCACTPPIPRPPSSTPTLLRRHTLITTTRKLQRRMPFRNCRRRRRRRIDVLAIHILCVGDKSAAALRIALFEAEELEFRGDEVN